MATMSIDYQTLKFDYRPRAQDTTVHPVIVVAAGLAAAIDLAQQGVSVVLLDDDDTLSTGSRAICFAKRTLEIFDRIGCGERFVDKGVSWHVGKVFLQDEQLYAFDLLPEEACAPSVHQPAAVLRRRLPGRPRVRAAEHRHPLEAQGHGHRPVRRARGADDRNAGGRRDAARAVRDRGRRLAQPDAHDDGPRKPRPHVQDRFLIADVKMKAEFPTERWFWFDPPFHPNQSVLLHRQPDNVWRIDFQLGWDADPVAEKQPERVIRARARCSGRTSSSSSNG